MTNDEGEVRAVTAREQMLTQERTRLMAQVDERERTIRQLIDVIDRLSAFARSHADCDRR